MSLNYMNFIFSKFIWSLSNNK